MNLRAVTLVVNIASLLTGCKNIGPDTVARDRYDSSRVIAEIWKRHRQQGTAAIDHHPGVITTWLDVESLIPR